MIALENIIAGIRVVYMYGLCHVKIVIIFAVVQVCCKIRIISLLYPFSIMFFLLSVQYVLLICNEEAQRLILFDCFVF